MNDVGRRIEIRGTVQGVGFRPWVWRLAREHGVAGRVANDSRGVTIEAFGGGAALESFLHGLRELPPPAAEIRELECLEIPFEDSPGFVIVESRDAGGTNVSIPPDLAICEACAAEIFDPADRRYRYPFTNCTNCGPRFTISRSVPYDRAATTMAPFAMCSPCRREYEDPANRRFHAQPNACPDCGPCVRALDGAGRAIAWSDPIERTAAALRAGLIVAVKGLGGFHLACDATSSEAVSRLRERKRREEKPFAVMVRDLAAAESLASLSREERRLLASPERPIVLAPRRPNADIAREVAPDTELVGLILPYTPLHHILLSDAGRPLVMTSGNLSDEPIVCDEREAVARLSGIADLYLTHDREIESRCDDSVVRVVGGGPMIFRRSRGWVPRPIAVSPPFEDPVLACGGHLKNTFCIGLGSSAFLGPHIGDLDGLDTFAAYEEAIARMERYLRVEPEIVAHDLHPEYASTVYARESRRGARVAVQHHHAHVASAAAEHGLAGPVIGIAFDGTGYGTDGTAWGAEVLVAESAGFERLGTFRSIALPGGETAIREPWRIAAALLEDAFPEGPPYGRIPLFREIDPIAFDVVLQVLRREVPSPRARGIGRYFDGFGSLFLGRPRSRYEGQIAMAWNAAADPNPRRGYPFAVDRTGDAWEIDLRPAIRHAVDDLSRGILPASISARFHQTIADAAAELVAGAVERRGRLPVVATGGCFQNALLAERVIARIERRGLRIHLPRRVPPGDGGLALGQAAVAAAFVRQGGC